MAAAKIKSNAYAVNLHRSQSEGTLIDLDDSVTINNNSLHGNYAERACSPSLFGILSFILSTYSNIFSLLLGSYANQIGNISEWSVLPKESENLKRKTNPFWNQLSRSNPFLNDIVQTSTYDSGVSMLKEDPITLSDNNDDSVSTSSDETNFAHLIAHRQSDLNRSGRWRSASDILDTLEKRESQKEKRLGSQGPFLNPDFEWLKNDREAYKMAWLSHRQLTRSCLDLSLMKQSPGWAQTQATDIQTVCKIDHHGGSVQLPETDITAHIAQGHVAPGEVQDCKIWME